MKGMNIGALAWIPSRRSAITWPISWIEEQQHEAERELQPQSSAVGGDRDQRRAGGGEDLDLRESSRTALSFASSATSAAPAAPSFSRSARAARRGRRRRPPARRAAGAAGSGGSSDQTGAAVRSVRPPRQVWQGAGGGPRLASFSGECGIVPRRALASPEGPHVCWPGRGTESQRARPPRCEALPPETGSPPGTPVEGSSSGFGPRRFRLWGTILAALRSVLQHEHPRGRQASTWSVRGDGRESRFRAASLITRKTNTCGLSRVRPRRLATTRTMRSRPPQPAAGITGIR